MRLLRLPWHPRVWFSERHIPIESIPDSCQLWCFCLSNNCEFEKGSTQAFGNFSQLSWWVGERMGQNRGHSQHLCCSHWKLNSEDANHIIWNIISVLSENSTDHLVFLLLLLILANVYLLQCFIQDLSRILLQIAIMNTPSTSDWLKAVSRFFMWTVHLHTVPSHIFQAMERCLYSRPLLHAYWQHFAALCHSDRGAFPILGTASDNTDLDGFPRAVTPCLCHNRSTIYTSSLPDMLKEGRQY